MGANFNGESPLVSVRPSAPPLEDRIEPWSVCDSVQTQRLLIANSDLAENCVGMWGSHFLCPYAVVEVQHTPAGVGVRGWGVGRVGKKEREQWEDGVQEWEKKKKT